MVNWLNYLKKIWIVNLYMKLIATTILSCLLVALGLTAAGADQQTRKTAVGAVTGWQKLADGLELGIFDSPQPAEIGDSKIRILRIDPGRYELKLLNASVSKKGRSLSAKQWCRQNVLVAAINASMFQEDFKIQSQQISNLITITATGTIPGFNYFEVLLIFQGLR